MTRAIVATGYGGPDVLALVERETPAPGDGQVTIAIRAAAVNPFDYKRYSGAFGRDPAQLPLALGMECAGVVTAVGADATGPTGALLVGDEVIASSVAGAYAEAITTAAANVVHKPANLSFEQAAGLILVGATAVHLLTATRVGEGDIVLVHGVSGGVGRAAAQLARARGARVIGTASVRRHADLAALGIEPVAYGDGLVERVRALAPGGVDAALDCVGSDEAIDASLALTHDRGRIATIAAFARAAELGLTRLGAGPGADPGTEVRRNARPELLAAAAAGTYEVVVARTFPLAEARAAHAFVMEGHAGGKVVLLP